VHNGSGSKKRAAKNIGKQFTFWEKMQNKSKMWQIICPKLRQVEHGIKGLCSRISKRTFPSLIYCLFVFVEDLFCSFSSALLNCNLKPKTEVCLFFGESISNST